MSCVIPLVLAVSSHNPNAQRVIDEFADFQRLIEGCINLDAAQNNEYQINASFDPEFTRWCEEKDQAKQKIDTLYRAVASFL